ncbi:MFS transporter [Paenibacillus prosopidis]|uniref:Transmembrane secretion effector n=1 Tax=Paenibacillus prosopidis TaxID=630520 RepID=A0A368W741_9BACL|nr:MFS transporter [Paenibacillus prosopidis]RCW51810.1 transmembrane secretion effector [Paenibacillus prosopidis]
MLELAKNSETNASAVRQQRPGTMSIWRNRTFMFVFSSYGLSLLGNTFHSIALNLWVLQTTGSAKLMSVVLITHLVISMLFGSFAGTIADRSDRRTLMWATDLVRFVLVAAIAVLIYLPGIPFIFIVILTGIVAFAGVLRTPAFQASLFDIVGKEQLTQAASAISVADNIIRISGFALGGIAVAAFGGVFAIAIDAVTFLLSAILLLFAGKFRYAAAKDITKPKASFKQDLLDGFRYVWNDSFARAAVILLPLVMFFFLSTFMLIQVMAVQVWKAEPFVFGLMEACIPLGYVAGSILIMRFDHRLKNRGKWIIGSTILMGPLFIAIAQIPSAAIALPFILLVGFLFSFSTTIIYIVLRVVIDPALQGRVFGLLGALTSVAPPIGLAVFSTLSDLYGPAIIITISGTAMLLMGIIAYSRMKSIRQFK